MKKALLLPAILLIAGINSRSADRRNFWLLNNTGRKIERVYVTPHDTDAPWGSDILGDTELPNGIGTTVRFLDNSSRCVYDIRIEFTDGSHEDYTQGRNLCEIHAIQFNGGTNDAF
jgi:hypothetical protein